ncbi:MAG: DUF116 domain-containing protein [Deltaproteobacteria bacterium]|nr:DUF116 domain-containing protein [Deltaproteobacteria bacterium]
MNSNEEKWTGSPESVPYNPGRGAFAALMAFSAVGLILAGFLFWVIPTIGLSNIHPMLPYVTGGILAAGSLVLAGGAILITIAAIKGKFLFYSPWFRGLLVKVFLPLMIMAGGILRIPRIKIEQAFIDLNNQMVKLMGRKFKPEKLLILMPHCIQFDNCKIKVTRNVRNCVGCGKCEIGELVSLSDEFGITLYISTGGTVARRKVYEERPDAVIAVACERDLTSGVQDAYPLPVLAIVNKRPRGYCMETGVAIEEVRQAIVELMPAVGA